MINFISSLSLKEEFPNFKEKSGIYAILKPLENRIYIGSSKDFNERFGEHRIRLMKNIHANNYLQNDWNKTENPDFSFLCD